MIWIKILNKIKLIYALMIWIVALMIWIKILNKIKLIYALMIWIFADSFYGALNNLGDFDIVLINQIIYYFFINYFLFQISPWLLYLKILNYKFLKLEYD